MRYNNFNLTNQGFGTIHWDEHWTNGGTGLTKLMVDSPLPESVRLFNDPSIYIKDNALHRTHDCKTLQEFWAFHKERAAQATRHITDMSKIHDHLPPFEPVYRCRGCGGITQTKGVSCDCDVPAPQDWQEGFAIFSIPDSAAAITAAREALKRAERVCAGSNAHAVAQACKDALNLLAPSP